MLTSRLEIERDDLRIPKNGLNGKSRRFEVLSVAASRQNEFCRCQVIQEEKQSLIRPIGDSPKQFHCSRKGLALKQSTIHLVSLLLVTGISSLIVSSCHAGNVNGSTDAELQPSFLTPAVGSPISLPCEPGNVVMGDMNNDKKPDLVASCGTSKSIIVLPGKGDGGFAPAVSSTTVTDSPGEMALGDVNGDGKLDAAIASHDSYSVVLLIGDGKGGLVLAQNSPILMKAGNHPHTHGLNLADMNHDNKLDIVTVNNADNDVSIALGDGNGSFSAAPGSPFAVGPSPYPSAVGDVNGDGYLDIVATATATGPQRAQQLPYSRALTLLLSDGKAGFSSRQLPLRTGEPWFAAIADINGDRKPDILATHHEMNALTVLFGDGHGGFVEADKSPFDFGATVFHIVVADLNHDGKMDVAAAGGDGLRFLTGDERGRFSGVRTITTGRGVYRLDLGDLNGDGKLDVVACNSQSRSLSVLVGR